MKKSKALVLSFAILFALVMAASCRSPSPDCECLKTGVFQSLTADSSFIYRNHSHELNINQRGDSMHLEIEWPSNCNYVLHFVSSTDPKYQNQQNPDLSIQVDKIDFQDSLYYYTASINKLEIKGKVRMLEFNKVAR
ncbi:hypothetical protein [Croceimicrobium hydrocarbonivorans]|uniref:Lipoprotein n=1 Tax=Croceimicrobium hydrocarbonivorans TaxID=2761580 RepID=A0A7H0VIE1_9FLAO|nr:hypothetical protein [Croceimicrobium hydrocarbonivorans]QNR25489.1 hypothetical protein H4K34_06515 [Croceimicrobium hydrocarbonivorans]